MTDSSLDELIELKRKLMTAQPTWAVSLTWHSNNNCSILWTDYSNPDFKSIIEVSDTEVSCVEKFLARLDVQGILGASAP